MSKLTKWLGISNLKLIQSGIQGRYYPPARDVLRAFRTLEPKQVRVVILGQDPYPGPGKASGLAFGLKKKYIRAGGRINSTILNIQNEVRRCGYPNFGEGDSLTLEHWMQQGVLLVNTSLTVEPGKPMSHRKIWGKAVAEVLQANLDLDNVVFLCWGREALDLAASIGASNIIATTHPCKFSHDRSTEHLRAFTGSRCFDLVNWNLPAKHKIYWGNVGSLKFLGRKTDMNIERRRLR